MKDEAPFLELPNDMKPKDYPQKFVYSNDFPKKAPEGKIERLKTVE